VNFSIRDDVHGDASFASLSRGDPNSHTNPHAEPDELVRKLGHRTSYLDQRVRMGAVRARENLEILDEDEGRDAVERCDYKALTPQGMQRAAEIIATDYQQAMAAADAP
jgi:hypothetical protein